MKNMFIEIEYDGTGYCGWQMQSNGTSIQQRIEEAVLALTGERTRVHGSGRTDAGVHALGQTATFMTDTKISPDNIAAALNSKLPDDIAVREAREVPDDFHARFSAKGKLYRYRIFNSRTRSPFENNRSYRFGGHIDVNRMKEASVHFLGSHDFRAFMASGSSVQDTVRSICRLDVAKSGSIIEIEAEGNGFLYNMVRIIAGTLLECGTGKRNPDDIPGVIKSCSRVEAGRTLPGYGLYLVRVFY